MSKKVSKRIQQAIIALLKEAPGTPVSRKEISHALNIHKKEYHIFVATLEQLVKDGKIAKLKGGRYTFAPKMPVLVGELRTTRSGYGFVMVEDQDVDIFVAQPNLNTAFDRDIVEVKLYASRRGRRLEGFVKRVVKRFRKYIVGTYHKTPYYSFITPDDPKVYRDIIVPEDKNLGAQDGQKVVAEFIRWEKDQHNPEGVIREVLGDPEAPGVDVASVAYSFNLPIKFPDAVEKEANRISGKFSAADLDGRIDLRDLVCFTIDPEDAKDFDDAVSLRRLENGNWELGVHIADVSHYVQPGSVVDKEAYARGTSVYLVDQVIPMLPEHLSNELCSLKPNTDRLTFSCLMEVDDRAEVVNYRISPSIIHSKQRFTYEQVQEILDGKVEHPFADVLKDMDNLREKLMQKRFEEGGIDFETPEVKIILDESGHPTEVVPRVRLNSHRLVEEFMLLANKTVARHIRIISPSKNKLLPFIYRVHEKPDEKKMNRFFEFLSAMNIPFKPVKRITSKYLQNLLRSIKGTKEEIIIEEVALRSMMKAVYSEKNIGHFGLGFKDYTHFTSPIRRYPDLTVHRLLRQYAQSVKAPAGLSKQLKEIARQATERERLAIEAERESIKLKQTQYISHHLGETFEGLVSGVMAFGIFVELKETFIEGMVPVTSLTDDFYIYDEKTYSMIGRDLERTIRLGDEVVVRVESVDLEHRKVEFSLIENLSDEPGRSEFILQNNLEKKNNRRTKRRKRRRK